MQQEILLSCLRMHFLSLLADLQQQFACDSSARVLDHGFTNKQPNQAFIHLHFDYVVAEDECLLEQFEEDRRVLDYAILPLVNDEVDDPRPDDAVSSSSPTLLQFS